MIESDEALYARLVGGDVGAFDRLYERFERPLFGFVRAQLGDAAEAEDVFHEAFLAVLRARDQGADVRSVKAWLFQVARNACLNRVRARERQGRAVARIEAVPVVDAPDEAAADPRALQAAVARLPPALAEVYQLRASGLSYEELSAILAVPLGTVKSRMHEMVKRLREEMT